jgi:hypothetical protein
MPVTVSFPTDIHIKHTYEICDLVSVSALSSVLIYLRIGKRIATPRFNCSAKRYQLQTVVS